MNLQRSLKIAPTATAYFVLAELSRMAKDYHEAAQKYKQALVLDPGHISTASHMGAVLILMENKDGMIQG